jgi:ABC-type glycerol-3-phosphate transport system substrate-binding protein
VSDIELSCMIDPEGLDLQGFEAQHRLRVGIQQMSWEEAWDHLLRFALHGEGPDVSEIGSTWLSSLIEMNALRPFVSWSGTFLRDMERFFPAARWAITRPGDFRIWAVPLFTDTRVIYYRREQLQEAGIDPEEAFQTTASLMATLKRLQERGVAVPWAMPTRGLDVLYNAASFIWASGGRIRTEDGRHLRLIEPEAQAGLRSFLSLHRFLAPPAQGLDEGGTSNLFQAGAVAALGGPWLLRQLEQDPEFLADVLGAELVKVNTTEGAAYGAALLAATGAGLFDDVESACAAVIRVTGSTEPGPAAAGYGEIYALYRDLYPALRPTFQAIGHVSNG